MEIASLARIRQFFSVPGVDENPELLKAQFAVFTRHIPLMYTILLISAWALAYICKDVAPAWLVLEIPAIFSLVCIGRLVFWYRSRNNEPTAKQARKALVRTNQLAALQAIAIGGWALELFQYGNHYIQVNVTFFIAITGICVALCLLHLRSAAFFVALIVNVPLVITLSLSANPFLIFMAVNMLVAAVTLMMVVFVQSQHFIDSVNAKTALEAVSRETLDLANLDSLTGLANRRQFFARLDAAFQNAQDKGEMLAVGVVDLDGFKPVNDLHGHFVGDKLLAEVGRRLRAFSDPNILVARLGGDEFALLIRSVSRDEALLDLGEAVCASLQDPFELGETTVQVSGSVGLAVYPQMASSAASLYERADYALYHSKRTDRGHAVLFSGEQAIEIERETHIEKALKDADLDTELEVYFQPIVDAVSGAPIAFEALARWNSPQLGSIPPDAFIPIAERSGTIATVTRKLLEKALQVADTWPDNIGLSFNLSARDVGSSESILGIIAAILSSGVNPRRLDFEITETAVMYNFTQSGEAIEMLRSLGCGIALDDFGTGYSSLSQLHALPLTKIKVDRSFVTNLDKNQSGYKIVKSLLSLSRDMGLGCIIEGIESKEELAEVVKLGGVLVQGYYFSPPVPADQTLSLLNNYPVAQVV